MKYKLICSDLDDTLLNSKSKINPSLKGAISEYVKSGGKFCIVTGRMTVGAVPIAKSLDLHGEIISYQGAIVSDIDTGEIIFSTAIDTDFCIKIGEFIEDNGYYYQIYVGDKFYTATPNEFSEIYSKLSNASYEKTNCKLSEYVRKNKLSSPKMLIMAEPPKIASMMEKLRASFGNDFLINTSKPFIIEIVPKMVNKGLAVINLAKKYGIKREEIICIGDSENDLTMFEQVPFSVCVSNGSEIAKSRAKVIAPTCDEDAVGWVIRNYGLK